MSKGRKRGMKRLEIERMIRLLNKKSWEGKEQVRRR